MAERLIAEGDTWRYYKGRTSTPPADSNANDWTQQTYDDSLGWGSGGSGFGYGDGDDATIFTDMQEIVGTQAGYFSVYVRKSFNVADPGAITRLTLAIDYDDGFVAYVNGVEVARRNMPAGAVSYNTPASGIHEASRGGGGSGGTEAPHDREFIAINPALLVPGTNVLAISGHNITKTSSDFTLQPELYTNVTLVRGPFLQMPTPGHISVVWRTDALTNSTVDFGPDTNYTGGSVTDPAFVREHVITLPVLPSNAPVYYRVRSSGVTLAESILYPPRGAAQSFRFAVYGDFGWGNDATGTVNGAPAAIAARVDASDPHLTLTVGDNIYNNGQPGLYDSYWFAPYAPVNRRAPVFPAVGNHDVDNPSNGQPFIDFFHLPKNGPAAYLERSYSFDYGNAHFAVVDVNPFVFKIDTTAQAAIKSWLANDLAATTQRWKFVLFHQPAYTSSGPGVHSPATILQNEIQPICAQYGVQMVFQGHNHFYERINPINGVNYITTGGGGRGLTHPTISPTYSAFVEDDLHSFTHVEINGGKLTSYQIDTAGEAIDSLALDLDHPFTIDGLRDPAAPERAANPNGLKLYAAIRGNFLYLATQDAGEGSDHFIYLNNQPAALQAANWAKAGQVMGWSAFLADENDNGFKGWHDASAQLLSNPAIYSAMTSGLNDNGAAANGVLEGTMDLPAHFGAFPAQIYVAAAPFATANGGALASGAQVPVGNGDGDVQPSEFLVLNTRDLALDLPVSNAGPDQSVEAGMQVLLNGSASAPSGLALTITWSQLAGPLVNLVGANQAAAHFTFGSNLAQPTQLTFRLRVNDTRFDSDDEVAIELFPMVDSDGDGLSDQEELTGKDNSLTNANPAGYITDPDRADSDGDGLNDAGEALAGTNPNDAGSVFRITEVEMVGPDLRVKFSAVIGRAYQLQTAASIKETWTDIGPTVIAQSDPAEIAIPASSSQPYLRVRIAED